MSPTLTPWFKMWSGVVDAGDDIETHNATCIRKNYWQCFLFAENHKHTVALTQRHTFIYTYARTLQRVHHRINPQRIKWHALSFRFVCILQGGSTAEGDQEILTYIKLRFEEKGWWSRCRWRVLAGWLLGWLTDCMMKCLSFGDMFCISNETLTHTQGCTPLFCLWVCACDRTICQNTKQQE